MTADRTEAADRVEPTVGGLIYLANLLEHGPTPLALKAVAQSLRDCAATLDDDRANSIARIRLDDKMAEKIAQAIHGVDCCVDATECWDEADNEEREVYRANARAVLDLLRNEALNQPQPERRTT